MDRDIGEGLGLEGGFDGFGMQLASLRGPVRTSLPHTSPAVAFEEALAPDPSPGRSRQRAAALILGRGTSLEGPERTPRMRVRSVRALLAGAIASLGLCLASAVPALASSGFAEISSFASPSGFEPVGVGVNNTVGLFKGDVYVSDRAGSAIDRFSAAGTWEGVSASLPGAGPFQVAVDENTGLYEGDVYVAGTGNGVVYRLSPDLVIEQEIKGLEGPQGVAVNQAGDVLVAQGNGNVLEFNAAGEPVDAAGVVDAANTVVSGLNSPQGIAVAASGELYIATVEGTFAYEPAGSTYKQAAVIDPAFADGVTVAAGSGDIFTDSGQEISELSPTGTLLAYRSAGVFANGVGLAFDEESGHLYVASINGPVYVFEEGPLPAMPTTEAAKVKAHTTFELTGTLGAATKGYYFAYNQGASCQGGTATSEVQTSGTSASAELSGLEPLAQYTFCLVATNPYGNNSGGALSFTTASAPPSVTNETFSETGDHSVVLSAALDTENMNTTYYFEYGAAGAHGMRTAPASAGAANYPIEVSTRVTEVLEPNTKYSFRLVAINEAGEESSAPEVSFTTLSPGLVGLPDGRVYEMVTPVQNANAEVYIPDSTSYEPLDGLDTTYPFEVAGDGNAVTYVSNPTEEGGKGKVGSGLGDQQLAKRAAGGGWTQRTIAPDGFNASRYWGFTDELSIGVLYAEARSADEPLGPEWPGEEYPALYQYLAESRAYRPLFTVKPPTRSIFEFSNQYDGGTANGSQLLFSANDALAPGAVGEGAVNLYDSVDGALTLVNILPNGSPVGGATFGGVPVSSQNGPALENVISSGGSMIYWTDETDNKLYVRENPLSPGATTVEVDESQGPGSSGGGRFLAATPDGEVAFFSDESRLTSDSTATAGAPDLYEWHAGALGQAGTLTDLTVDPHGGESASVQGILGVSEDGSHVYFVATGVLASNANEAGKSATPGADNLYLKVSGTTTFIGTLSPEDGEAANPFTGYRPGSNGDWQAALGHRTADVTPDGRAIVFMSDQPLAADPTGGDQEVYVYEAESGRLTCVSCSRSGEMPRLTTEGAAGFIPISYATTYLQQTISDADGRLRVFFDTAQPLVPQDTNGVQDVYEWERDGSGSCTEAAGCQYLLTRGAGVSDSWLIGTDAGGENVFVISRDHLAPQDEDETFNVFDARVGGVEPVTTACNGTGCQGPPEPPPYFATPPSVTFGGVGNFATGEATTAPPNTKTKTTTPAKKKLEQALRACERKPKRTRATCERRARKRYASATRTAKHAARGRK